MSEINIITEEGVGSIEAADGNPNLEALGLTKLRRLSKSISISLDVETKKLTRLTKGSSRWREASAEHQLLDELDVDIKSAIHNVIHDES